MYSFTEHSESDATTTYHLTRQVCAGKTATGTEYHIGDSDVYGRMLFLDGELQSASADEVLYHESLVHPVMACATKSRANVLVVGGGEGATVREVLRWSDVKHVDWVDYDAELVALCQEHLGWNTNTKDDPRVTFYPLDIKVALEGVLADRVYDIIVLDLPDPDGETGFLYSPEFWTALRAHLVDSGRIVTHCGPVRPYGTVGAGFQRIHASLGGPTVSFYSITIPSFQGEWGFTVWPALPSAESVSNVILPAGLAVVDERQLTAWLGPPARVWATKAP